MSNKISIDQLQQRASGTPSAAPWEQYENGNFVDYFAPSIDGVYVSDPDTGRHLYSSQNDAVCAAQRYQDKVREYLAKNIDSACVELNTTLAINSFNQSILAKP